MIPTRFHLSSFLIFLFSSYQCKGNELTINTTTSLPSNTPTDSPTYSPTTVPAINYNTATGVMKELKSKYKKLLRAGLNAAWESNVASGIVDVELYINETNPVGNISYMVLEIYDDDDCLKPVMQAGLCLLSTYPSPKLMFQ